MKLNPNPPYYTFNSLQSSPSFLICNVWGNDMYCGSSDLIGGIILLHRSSPLPEPMHCGHEDNNKILRG